MSAFGTIAGKGLGVVAILLAFQLATILLAAALERTRQREIVAELRSRETRASADRVLSLLVDVETSQRGYTLTQSQAFLEPYNRAVIELPGEFEGLRARSGPAHTANLDRLEAATQRLLTYHARNQELVAEGHVEDAIGRVRAQNGKRLMDEARAIVGAIRTAQSRIDEVQAAASARTRKLLNTAVVSEFVLTIIVGVSLALLFVRRITSRLQVIVENTARLESNEPLRERLTGNDEIAVLDARFHEMAAALATNRRELVESNREIESFSYTVSHDLRAPIRAMDGYAQMLEEDCAGALDDRGRRYIAVIRKEAKRMATLIDDLLAFSRIGRKPLAVTNVDLTTLVESVFREVNVEGRVELRMGALPELVADPALLRQAITNLLSNAVKFTAGVENPIVEVSTVQDDEFVTVRVKDNGVGFDTQYSSKLFQVFQRLHQDDEFEGTGVGLAIVHRVVTRHGGEVWAASAPGEGATFYFKLPRGDR